MTNVHIKLHCPHSNHTSLAIALMPHERQPAGKVVMGRCTRAAKFGKPTSSNSASSCASDTRPLLAPTPPPPPPPLPLGPMASSGSPSPWPACLLLAPALASGAGPADVPTPAQAAQAAWVLADSAARQCRQATVEALGKQQPAFILAPALFPGCAPWRLRGPCTHCVTCMPQAERVQHWEPLHRGGRFQWQCPMQLTLALPASLCPPTCRMRPPPFLAAGAGPAASVHLHAACQGIEAEPRHCILWASDGASLSKRRCPAQPIDATDDTKEQVQAAVALAAATGRRSG